MEIESWFSRHRFLCIFLLLLAVGLLITGAAYFQKSYDGVVTEVSEISYRPASSSIRVKSKASYGITATVSYTDEDGEEQSAKVTIRTIHRNSLPRVGDRLTVCRSLRGHAAYPNRNILAAGETMAIIGGLFSFCILLVELSEWKKNRER